MILAESVFFVMNIHENLCVIHVAEGCFRVEKISFLDCSKSIRFSLKNKRHLRGQETSM